MRYFLRQVAHTVLADLNALIETILRLSCIPKFLQGYRQVEKAVSATLVRRP